MFDCSDDVKGYHSDEVNLSNDDQGEMRSRRDAGRTRLSGGLKKSGYAQPSDIQAQGSYAMRTMVQDDQCDYDVDDGIYFEKDDLKDAAGNFLTPKQTRERVASALKDDRLAEEAKVKNNCVRQVYPQGYHIDLPVYRVTRSKDPTGNEVVTYELASGELWVKSDAREVTRWFRNVVGSELKRGEMDSSQLRRVTKLTKKLARSREDWKSKTTSGITITKLVVDHFAAAPGRDDQALRETWKAIKGKLDITQTVVHPVLIATFLANNGDEKVRFLRSSLSDALMKLNVLDDSSCNLKKARDAWDGVFGCEYFSDLPDDDDDGSGSKSRGISILGGGVAKRNDGGGRYG
ncbi:MAG: hypothetical protein WDO12_11345 [Pseudomonadota bacterium]